MEKKDEQYNVMEDVNRTIQYLCNIIRSDDIRYEDSKAGLTIALAELVSARARIDV